MLSPLPRATKRKPQNTMQITIIHDESSIDPGATYTPEEFQAVRESLESEYTKEITKAFPAATVYFQSGSGLATYCLRVEGDEDNYESNYTTIHAIMEAVWETGNFWL